MVCPFRCPPEDCWRPTSLFGPFGQSLASNCGTRHFLRDGRKIMSSRRGTPRRRRLRPHSLFKLLQRISACVFNCEEPPSGAALQPSLPLQCPPFLCDPLWALALSLATVGAPAASLALPHRLRASKRWLFPERIARTRVRGQRHR
jgi:hypothetical protein